MSLFPESLIDSVRNLPTSILLIYIQMKMGLILKIIIVNIPKIQNP